MNTPPSDNAPSGAPYTPPQPPKSGSGGCWKAAGLTCGVLFLVALIAVFFVGRAVKENISHSHKGNLFGTLFSTGRATQDGIKIQQAVVAYRKAHGHYPSSLLDLVSEGRIDGKILHNDLDPSPSPTSISWHYTKPAPDAPGSTPLLTEHFRLDIPGSKAQSADSALVITLDGKAGSSTATGQ